MTTDGVRSRLRRAAATAAIACAAIGTGAGGVWAQIPDKFTNLQVLPKDIRKQDLVATMRGFCSALGVRCTYCHVGEEGKPLDTFDFTADTKDHKRIARTMMQMTAELNSKWIARVEHEGRPPVQVGCATCHHGKAVPRTLQEVLGRTLAERGAVAAVAQYRELRDKFYGRDAYDFGEQSLNAVAETLADQKKTADAVALLQLNAEFYPKSPSVQALLAGVHEQAGDKAAAIAAYQKVLELAPNDERAKRKLADLRGGARR